MKTKQGIFLIFAVLIFLSVSAVFADDNDDRSVSEPPVVTDGNIPDTAPADPESPQPQQPAPSDESSDGHTQQ